MKTIAFPLAALASVSAAEVPAPAPPAGPEAAIRELRPFVPPEELCRDRITQARDAAGKPPLLEREPASPDKPYLIYAVDKRVDGCAAMVMHGDASDIRPLPARPEGPLRLMPLERPRERR